MEVAYAPGLVETLAGGRSIAMPSDRASEQETKAKKQPSHKTGKSAKHAIKKASKASFLVESMPFEPPVEVPRAKISRRDSAEGEAKSGAGVSF